MACQLCDYGISHATHPAAPCPIHESAKTGESHDPVGGCIPKVQSPLEGVDA
jgi:hypothetical protein